jgi:hypothetical protein
VRDRTDESVDVHRRGRHGIAVYAFTERAVRHAENVLLSILAEKGLKAQTALTRWNPGLERWQDPTLPVERSPSPPELEWLELGELAWEVRVALESRADARRIEERFRDEGHPTRNDGRKRFAVGVADQTAAASVADRITLLAPFARIEVRRLSRFRRWLIRQGMAGNYAEGGGGGEWGGWGGGDGGGGA